MSSTYQLMKTMYGSYIPSNVGKRREEFTGTTGGLSLRGVVTQVFYEDDNKEHTDNVISNEPNLNIVKDLPNDLNNAPARVQYCEVLVYAGLPKMRRAFLPRVLITQSTGGNHDGEVYIPKPTTFNLATGGTVPNNLKRVKLADLDGDHVVVSFFDNDFLPYISRYVSGPQQDLGNGTRTNFGARLRLRKADGRPRFIKHRGVVHGVDNLGNYVVDTTRGQDGQLDSKGRERRLPTEAASLGSNQLPMDGTNGNQTYNLPQGSVYEINILTDPLDPANGITTKIRVEHNKVTLSTNIDNSNAATSIEVDGTGTITIKPKSNGQVLIGQGSTSSKNSARINDTTLANSQTDAAFFQWVSAIDAFIRQFALTSAGGKIPDAPPLAALAALSAQYVALFPAITNAPAKVDGKISSGSGTVFTSD